MADHATVPAATAARLVIYKALGIPVNMFTVMFTLGRLPGWIAHWIEMRNDPDTRIERPRQIYTGETEREYKRPTVT